MSSNSLTLLPFCRLAASRRQLAALLLLAIGTLFFAPYEASAQSVLPEAPNATALNAMVLDQRASFHPRRLLVAPSQASRRAADSDAHALAVETALAQAGASTLRELPQIGWRIIEVESGKLFDAKATLEASGLFREVSLDRAMRLAHVPDDPYWPGMWHMTQIRADLAWDLERGDSTISVAVIDTGLDGSHPDLASNLWVNTGEIPGNGIDDDGNGYIDDVNGYDFAYDDPDPDDVFGHGTACAGIVAAEQDNQIGVTGVAPRCKVAGLKAALDTGYLYDSAVVPALLYAADMGFQVASMSFYGDGVTPAQGEAIAYCVANGLLPVASAGNSDQVLPYYPAAFDGTLAVGATGPGDSRSWFSNRGTWVGVAAPGQGISTSTPGAGYTTTFAGTSGSCPHVAGLAALLFSAAPTASASDVRAAIEDSAVLLDQPPYGKWSAYGRIDARAAVERILGTTSGSVPARLDFVSPSGGTLMPVLDGTPSSIPELHMHGVGFEDATLRVLRAGSPQVLNGQERQLVSLPIALTTPGPLELEVASQIVSSLTWESAAGWLYTPSDASTKGGGSPVTLGGFFELYREDASVLTCTRRDDGIVYLLLAIRDVRLLANSKLSLQFVRSYVDATGATERVRLYDWSTGSYPYGSWQTISTRTITSTATESLEFDVSGDPTRFVDAGGTIYVQVETSATGGNGELRADVLRLVVR